MSSSDSSLRSRFGGVGTAKDELRRMNPFCPRKPAPARCRQGSLSGGLHIFFLTKMLCKKATKNVILNPDSSG
jgi:hypothetical protein